MDAAQDLSASQTGSSLAIPAASVGMGLRAPHFNDLLTELPEVSWLEVHSENYLDEQGVQRYILRQVAQHYPLSFHGVGLSLGSSDPLNPEHLTALKKLIDEFQPALLSEHLSWSSVSGRYFNDLLPIPYTQESLEHFCRQVDQAQQVLGRQILVENPTAYLNYKDSIFSEWDFLNQIVEQTGCGLLLDLNNIYVNSVNHSFDCQDYLDNINLDAVGELHLAGFSVNEYDQGRMLIDTHGNRVSDPVWQLFAQVRHQLNCQAPALVEWDTDIPEMSVLLEEVGKAEAIQQAKDIEQVDITKLADDVSAGTGFTVAQEASHV
ncbi:DUF692 domain-containing protein [Oceanospirillum beijerinckii]|uniref:MNIO family bufferin maturase n=1 Tax=Oceanospirillum beijerinckii TaxID=64976 RepID=UPI0003FCF5C6|nr:DUF692 domain-containing protein [Oceanospirillum beijerinckii]